MKDMDLFMDNKNKLVKGNKSFENDDLSPKIIPELKAGVDNNGLLDYIVLVISSSLQTNVAFKGGWLLNKLMDNSRMTRDADFSIEKREHYEEIKEILKLIGDKFKELDYISEYKIKEDISPTCAGGIDMYNKTGSKFLGVDIGMHNISYGIKPYNLSFDIVNGFVIERMLADKLVSILSSKRCRRTKDLYDFFIITDTFNIDLVKLKEYVKLRGNAEWENIPFSDIELMKYEKAWDKLKLLKFDTGDILLKPDFRVVIDRFNKIAYTLKYDYPYTKWDVDRKDTVK